MAWKVAGSYYEVCNCEAICPCRRIDGKPGGEMMYESCDFATSWWVNDGDADGVSLAGLRVVMAGRWAKQKGNPFHITLYIDERATAEQEALLASIFLGRAGGYPSISYGPNIVEVHAIKRAQIELDHTRGKEKIDVGPFLTVRAREVVPHDGTVSCGVPGHDRPGQEIVTEVFKYQDTPYDWELRGKCGFATTFAYAS
jgi:hypothetical protein